MTARTVYAAEDTRVNFLFCFFCFVWFTTRRHLFKWSSGDIK